MRWPVLFAGLLAFQTLGFGCATNRAGSPFGNSNGRSSTAQLAKKSAKNDATAAGDKTSAGGAGAGLAAGKGSKSPADGDDDGTGSASRGAKNAGHDPETVAYINEQLRDATPEERAELLPELNRLNAGAVREVLKQRRLGINAKKQQELAWQRNRSTRPGAITPTGGDMTADAGRIGQFGATQNEPAAAGSRGLPIGHSSAYRSENPPTFDAATMPPAASLGSRNPVHPASGLAAVGSAGVTQADASDKPAGSREAPARPASVAMGLPMNAGTGPVNGAGVVTAGGMPVDATTREQTARLIAAVETEAFAMQPGETDAEKLAYINKQVDLRRLYLISGQQERALQAIPGIDPADQEFLQQLFWAETNYFDSTSMPSASERAAQTVTQLSNAVLRLQEKASLELRNVTFCQKISNFGNFEKYPREEFSPGQEVLLYAEVANIHSEPIPDGKFRTSLKSTIEVFRHGSQGELIERIDLPATVDICRNHRHDYFHSYQYTIPTKLTLGPHILKLTLEDQLSRRVATYSLNFTVK